MTGRPPDLLIVNQVLPDRFDRREINEIERVLGTCTDPSLHASAPAVRRAWHRAREQARPAQPVARAHRRTTRAIRS